jgi:mRNA-degrading endonuclease RelE of RelBE toxin-antitoxin system
MYTIVISESALKELHKLPKHEIRRIEKNINALSENPRPSV